MAVLAGALLVSGASAAQEGAGIDAAREPEVPGTQSLADACLLERLRAADPRVTVAEILAACAPYAAGASLAEVEDSTGEAGEGRAELLAPLPDQETTPAPATPALATITAPVLRRVLGETRLWSERFALLPHRPNYILPISHATSGLSPRDEVLQRNEIKLQLSFKFPLTPPLFEGRAALFFAYTGQYWWQAYNDDISSPFREYGHEPEIFLSWSPSFSLLGWDARVASVGYVHQSNGRARELSRSWNRLFAEVVFDRPDGWWLALRPWWRISEDEKKTPDSPGGDDNPEITRYAGDGELRLGHVGELNNWTVTLRRGLRSGGKGAVQLDWSRPTGFSPQLRWYAQYYDGYGESLLDHDVRLQRFGFGVMLNDWF